MKYQIRKIIVLVVLFAAIFSLNVVSAQVRALNTPPPNTPELNPNSSSFKIVVCDGPENAGRVDANGNIDLTRTDNGKGEYVYPVKNGYIPCNFNGLMLQIQHLINIMMVIGILAAVFAFSWAGALYISGNPAKKQEAHAIFPKIFKGLIIMLSAWFIVYQILSWLTNNDGFKSLLGSP